MGKILSIILIVVLLAGCASCNNTNQQKMEPNTEKSVLKKPVEPGLSPGTVLLKANLLDSKTSKSFNTLLLKVIKVLDYGHSTPIVAKGEKINVIVKNKKLMELLIKDKPITILLRHSPPKVGEETSAEWILSTIK